MLGGPQGQQQRGATGGAGGTAAAAVGVGGAVGGAQPEAEQRQLQRQQLREEHQLREKLKQQEQEAGELLRRQQEFRCVGGQKAGCSGGQWALDPSCWVQGSMQPVQSICRAAKWRDRLLRNCPTPVSPFTCQPRRLCHLYDKRLSLDCWDPKRNPYPCTPFLQEAGSRVDRAAGGGPRQQC